MVWVNPPNRVNYTVIPRIRNVHSRKLSEFDATRSKMFNSKVHRVVTQKCFPTISLVQKKRIDCEFEHRLNSCD